VGAGDSPAAFDFARVGPSCPSRLTLVLNLSIRSKVKFKIKVKSDGQECPSYAVKIESQKKPGLIGAGLGFRAASPQAAADLLERPSIVIG
jgi:hypothetical protein